MRSLTPRRLAAALFVACGSFALFVMASNSPPPARKPPVAPGNATPRGCCSAWGPAHQSEGHESRAEEFFYHHDHIIGTSLDVWVTALDEAAADLAERTILEEIERLKRIFSTYEPASEISQLNRTNSPVTVSTDMIEVLRQYETWQERSHGAFNGQLGELVRLWQEAEKTQLEPTRSAASSFRSAGRVGRSMRPTIPSPGSPISR